MKNYHLHLRGFVGGYDFDSRHVQNVLDANKGKRVDVLIDSLGGSVATALTIASAFRNHGDVHVHFVGMNASAATIASMGAKEITMDGSAMYLVHKCSTEFFQWASLNADQLADQIKDLSQLKTDLEKIDANVASLYAKRCGKTQAELLELMKVGGWLNAEEAKTWGFVDTVTADEEDEAPVLTDAVASAMAAVGMPIPNVPVQASSQFQKFIAALTEFFKPSKKAEQAQANAEQAQAAPEPVNQPKQTITMKKFPFLAAVLLMADAQIALIEGKFSLDEQQLGTLEDALKAASENAEALKAAQTRISELEAQLLEANTKAAEAATLRQSVEAKNLEIQQLQAKVEELGKQPGDTTQQVHNNAGEGVESPMDDFFQRLQAAKALYDMV